MVYVEVLIWPSKKKKGTPIKIDGDNFRPLIRAQKLVDELKTKQLLKDVGLWTP